jgi:hypothetical protein
MRDGIGELENVMAISVSKSCSMMLFRIDIIVHGKELR